MSSADDGNGSNVDDSVYDSLRRSRWHYLELSHLDCESFLMMWTIKVSCLI